MGKKFETGREMLQVVGVDGTFDYSPYDHGLYNGMEFMLSMIEEREPEFRNAPKQWLHESAFKTWMRRTFGVPKYKLQKEVNFE